MRNLKILLLSRKFDIYSSRRLVEEARLRSHEIYLWDPAWPLERCKVLPDVIIPRLASFEFQTALASLSTLEQRAAVTLNKSSDYSRARNKWFSYEIFCKHHIPAPESQLLPGHDFSFPCIVKELESSKGDGVFLVQNEAEFKKYSDHLGAVGLVQTFYPEAFGTDVRAFVVGNQIVAAMKRTAQPGEFRSNLSLGGTGEPCSLSTEETEIVLKTVACLNLQVSGVDLLRTRKGSLVLEANPCPGLEGIEKYTKQNLAEKIIRYAEEIYDKTSSPR
ncbi:MAG: RimK family alpha-L-glutamate ligase [Bdellovibrio sp.]